ncbi:MAG TPA: hypothetical protein VNB22_05045 [Pyrinomonadaceae bacterium]|nr:hypothetical protein [Pyrinomonadaceae bacterium]
MISFRRSKKIFYRHFWWFVLAACLLALVFYGLSAFTANPTVETITTHAPVFNANNNQMREVDFQPQKKTRKR